MRKLSALLALSLALTSLPANAWNDRGHMSVAGVAWNLMTPRARARAIALLQRNPDYRRWIANVPRARRDEVAFMLAATWPDDLRGRVCGTPPRPGCIRNDGYTPPDAGEDQNIGYRDLRLRAYWHFMDLPYSSDGTAGDDPFRFNAETQIIAFTQSLTERRLDDEAKSFNLTWLLHIVGDVHQPLHATARFNVNFRNGDNGGNGVVVCNPPPARCVRSGDRALKLHSAWDRAFGEGSDPRPVIADAERMARELRRPSSDLNKAIAQWALGAPPRAWFEESRDLAIRYAYVAPVGPDRGPYTLTDTYRQDMEYQATLRIAIAGARLARLLNRVLG